MGLILVLILAIVVLILLAILGWVYGIIALIGFACLVGLVIFILNKWFNK